MTSLSSVARHLISRTVRGAAALLLLTALVALTAEAQTTTTTTTSVTDGRTPSGLQPGSPAGSFELSGFDNVNLYNGNLSFHLPLLSTGGRGSAGYTMTLALDLKSWHVKHNHKEFPDGSTTDSFVPTQAGWAPYAGYGAGALSGRNYGVQTASSVTCRWYSKTLSRLTFSAADGTEYELRDQLTGGQPLDSTCTQGAYRGKVFVTADGTAATFISDTDIYDNPAINVNGPHGFSVSGYLMLRGGTRYRIDGGSVTWMRDRNGNEVGFSYTGSSMTVTDELGRTVTVNYNVSDAAPYGLCDQIVYKGFGGAQRVLRVSHTNLGSALRPNSGYAVKMPGGSSGLFPELNGSSSTNYDPMVVSAVWLPDGRSYKLYYNPYGELARVELPTGGAVEYDMTPGSGVVYACPTCNTVEDDKEIYRRVVERRVYPDGSTGSTFEHRDVYTSSEVVGTPSSTVTVEQLSQSGTPLARSRHYFDGSALDSMFVGDASSPYGAWYEGNERQTDELDTAGGVSTAAVLRRVAYTRTQRAPVPWWASYAATNHLDATKEPPNDPRLVTRITTVEPSGANLVSKQTAVNPSDGSVGFDQYNNPTDVWEYDYGTAPGTVGAFVRRTHTDYVTAAAYLNADVNPAAGASLRGLISQQWVSTDADGTNKASLTTYTYDQFSLTDRPQITGICTYYPNGACSATGPNGESSAAYTTRGNVTAVTRYANAAAASGAVTATSHYDIAGNVVSATDARGNTSTVSFDDSFCNDGGVRCANTYTPNTYAFATSTTSPVPDPAGQYGSTTALVTSAIYDYYTGLVYSTTDANNQTTTLQYNDVLDRPTAQIRPGTNGGRTDVEYHDTAGDLYVRVLTDLDSTRRTESRQYFDGLGRGVRSFRWENQDAANPWLTGDTQYDALGRAYRTSSQYRSAGPGSAVNPSGKWTQSTFDALGRVTQVQTTADGAYVTTSYSGNTVTVTDQHDASSPGRKRRSVTDALGRLTRVDEPDKSTGGLDDASGNPVQPTSYTYDALGNVRTVTQSSQTRTFVYDSLSRLTSATNPESGTTTYTYDDNGNVRTKTDARGTVSTYGYDALNRNTTVTYTPGGLTAFTPDVKRYYDGATLGRGRLWKSESVQNALTTVDQYDELGRPKQQTQQFWVAGAWGQAYVTQLSYNRGGGITSVGYPSGHSVSYSYEAAGRAGDNGTAKAFSGNLGDGVQRTYASEVRYQEMGGREQERFGTDTPVYNKGLYNSRGQLAEIRVSTYAITETDPNLKTNWNRGAIINHYSNAAGAWGATGGGADNNGNLQKQDIYIPDNDQISGYSQSTFFYNYDSLNRLYQARESYGGSNIWVQYFDYDRWGNRTVNQSLTTGSAPKPNYSVDASTNRLTVPAGQGGAMSYDPAGNLTNDTYQGGSGGGGTRGYDAENRMTSAQFVSGQTQTAAYTYDADGRRIKRNMGAGGEVWQVYGLGGELLAEYAPNASPSTPQREYGYRAGELLVTADAGSGVTSAGLVGYWKLDEGAGTTAADSSGLGNNGTLQSGTTWAAGKAGGAASFDGADDYVQVGASSSLSMSSATTLSAWVYPTGAGIIMAKEGEYEVARFSDGTIQWAFANSNPGWAWVNTGYVAPANQWTNITVTYSAGVVKTYANGQLVHTYTGAGSVGDVDTTQNDFRVGGRQCCSQYFAGRIDEVRVYSRALSAAEVADVAGASAAGGVRWMVSDQLGTPRMVIDRTGSLSGVTRHDHLPFGEEVPGDVTWRTPARGYVSDNVRQKFTKKERDAETNLDFFEARYYSSTMGRFTSPDEFSGGPDELYDFVDDAADNPTFYADLTNPQSLNKYQYAYNNPFRYVDPDGHEPDVQQGQQYPDRPPICAPDYCTPAQEAQRYKEWRERIRRIEEANREYEEKEKERIAPRPSTDLPGATLPIPAPPLQPLPAPEAAHKRKKQSTGSKRRTAQKHEEGEARKESDRRAGRTRPPRKPDHDHLGPWPPQPFKPDPDNKDKKGRKNPCPTCRPDIPYIEPKTPK